jgi:decaprenylphospho-beta-D-erythro-pentofuranosid-2-ulose 2-reductase
MLALIRRLRVPTGRVPARQTVADAGEARAPAANPSRPNAVLVLGGGSEIGLAIATRLVARGARRVVLAGREPHTMSAAAAPLRDWDADVHTVPFDASHVDSHDEIIAATFGGHGEFDVVVLAFAVLGDQAVYEEDPGAAGRDATVNYAGAVSSGLAVARQLREQGRGTLVILSSVAGQRPRRDSYVYGSAKAGLDAFAEGLREALHGTGVRVLVVRPGFVRTRMTAAQPTGLFAVDADAVARATARGLDRGASVVWVPRLLRWYSMLLRALPGPIFRLFAR